MMRLYRRVRLLVVVAILAVGVHAASALEENSVIATDGSLYVVRAGTAAELGIAATDADPADSVIQWSLLRQDGTQTGGLLPGTATVALKHNINLVSDDTSGSLIVLWTEEAPLLNFLRFGVLKGGQWTISDLLPNLGFSRAYNPQMLLSHLNVHMLDAQGNDVWATHSVLSVVWFEESNVSQARYAPIFLDDDQDASDIQIYDLPATIGNAGPTNVPLTLPPAAYMFPALQPEGPAGGILASFADLHAGLQYVVRINFPTDLGLPGPTSLKWQRRHIPVVGIAGAGGFAGGTMMAYDVKTQIGTYIGANYHPTFVWNDSSAVYFTHFDGKQWSNVSTITLTPTMTYDKAIRLVQDMATKN